MEEYDYEIEYVKGKENKVADCLSRLFTITKDTQKEAMKQAGTSESEDEAEELEKQSSAKVLDTPVIIEDRILKENEKVTIPMPTPPKETFYEEYTNWRINPSQGKVKKNQML